MTNEISAIVKGDKDTDCIDLNLIAQQIASENKHGLVQHAFKLGRLIETAPPEELASLAPVLFMVTKGLLRLSTRNVEGGIHLLGSLNDLIESPHASTPAQRAAARYIAILAKKETALGDTYIHKHATPYAAPFIQHQILGDIRALFASTLTEVATLNSPQQTLEKARNFLSCGNKDVEQQAAIQILSSLPACKNYYRGEEMMKLICDKNFEAAFPEDALLVVHTLLWNALDHLIDYDYEGSSLDAIVKVAGNMKDNSVLLNTILHDYPKAWAKIQKNKQEGLKALTHQHAKILANDECFPNKANVNAVLNACEEQILKYDLFKAELLKDTPADLLHSYSVHTYFKQRPERATDFYNKLLSFHDPVIIAYAYHQKSTENEHIYTCEHLWHAAHALSASTIPQAETFYSALVDISARKDISETLRVLREIAQSNKYPNTLPLLNQKIESLIEQSGGNHIPTRQELAAFKRELKIQKSATKEASI